MEENSEIIEQFASVLKEKLEKKPSAPYAASVYQNQWATRPKNTFTAKDVISEVSKQMLAIQNADCIANNKRTSITLNKYKKSTFVSVTALARVEMPNQKPSTNKPDANSQLTMDTQLLNVIKDAEALPGITGVTQEFYSSFHPEDVQDGPLQFQKPCPILDISLKAPDPKKNMHFHTIEEPSSSHTEKHESNDQLIVFNQSTVLNADNLLAEDNIDFPENIASCSKNNVPNNDTDFQLKHVTKLDINVQPNSGNQVFDKGNTSQNDNKEKSQNNYYEKNSLQNSHTKENNSQNSKDTKIESKLNDIQMFDEDIEMEVDIVDSDTKMPSSQILSMTKSTRSKPSTPKPSSLVVDLETFEKFETIASTLVAEHIDSSIEVVKEILSSQLDQNAPIIDDSQIQCSQKEVYDNNRNENETVDTDAGTQEAMTIQALLKHEQHTNDGSHKFYNNPDCNVKVLVVKLENINNIQRSIKVIDNDQSNKDCDLPKSIEATIATNDDQSNLDIRTNTLLNNTGNLSSVLTKSDKRTSNLVIDEILFSSDEEEEEEYNNMNKTQDLPFTCALETSFYDEQSDVLDKTMYVAFHTASNKSIQVLTDSFSKAKSFLDDPNEGKEKTVSELVDICSSSKQSLKSVKTATSKTHVDTLLRENSFEHKLEDIKDKITNTITSDSKYVTCDDVLAMSEKQVTECLEIDVGNTPEDLSLSSTNESMIVEDQNWSNLLMIKKSDTNTTDDTVDMLQEKTEKEIAGYIAEDVDCIIIKSQELFDESNDDLTSIEVQVDNKPYTSSQIISFASSKVVAKVCEIKSDGSTDEYQHLPIIETKEMDLVTSIKMDDIKMNDTFVIKEIIRPSSPTISFEYNVPIHNFEAQEQSKIQVITTKETESPLIELVSSRDTQLPETSLLVSSKDIELPKSQIISNTTRMPKRKRKRSQTSTNKKHKVELPVETKTDGLIDIEFDTCDFKEITFKDSKEAVQKTDELNKKSCKINSKEIITDVIDLVSNSKGIDPGDEGIYPANTETTSIFREENDKHKFPCFKTASNKTIEISKEAISRSKDIFQDLAGHELLEQKSNHSKENTSSSNIILEGLKTARKISPLASFEETTITFNDIDNLQASSYTENNTNTETIINSGTDTDNSEEPPLHGFLITEKDKMNVMKEIETCKKVFEELVFDTSILDVENVKSQVITTTVAGGDKTKTQSKKSKENHSNIKPNFEIIESNSNVHASNQKNLSSTIVSDIKKDKDKLNSPFLQGDEKNIEKSVKLSEAAQTKIEYFLKDIDKMCKEKLIFDPDTGEGHIPSFGEFQTASKKPVKISSKSLERTKKIFQNIDQDLDPESEFEIPQFQGFQTASKKPVHISAKALERSKKVFQDIDKSDNCVNPIASTSSSKDQKPQFQGFQTASRKPVHISSKALARTKKIFENIELTDEDQPPAPHNTESMFGIKYQGFQKANNKPVEVSKEALAKSRKLYQDMNDIDSNISINNNFTIIPMDARFQGFQTASNKPLKISDEALTKSRKLFQDVNEEDTDIATNTTDISRPVNTKFQGFQTASNKAVKISADALAKSKKIFQDINDIPIDTDIFSDIGLPVDTKFDGFQSASNKPVNVSAEALAKTKNTFQDINDLPTTDTGRPIKSEFQGFQTASNKKVKISAEALAKSRKIFQDITDVPEETDIGLPIEAGTKFQGFQTASNKAVKISEEALAKSRKIFQDIEDVNRADISRNNTDILKQTDNKFQAFQTASNKEVKISKEALAKSRKIFQDIITEKATNNIVVQKFHGFQTASNKEVNISEEALAKSKHLFQDIDLDDPAVSNNDTSNKFQGFSTASNKKVQISEQALEKSKKLFQDLESGNQPSAIEQIQLDFSFTTASNTAVVISEEALAKSKQLFANIDNHELEFDKVETHKKIHENTEDMDIINTQVLNNFEQTLHSEDFFKDTAKTIPKLTPKVSKRSGSPILSCPKIKKRKKFEIPYSQKVVQQKDSVENIIQDSKEGRNEIKEVSRLQFEENYKIIKTYTLKDLIKLEIEDKSGRSEADPYILNFNFENLLDFEFLDHRNDLELPITHKNNMEEKMTESKNTKQDSNKTGITTRDLIQKFEDSVNKTLIPNGWTENHTKLILWKLISYEIRFPKAMKNTCTAKNVIEQLKYRYDKELFNAERPALRKIFEKDDIPSRTLILCVVAILVDGVQVISPTTSANLELLLTDGWYLIKGSIDQMLSKLVCEGKITVGTKIVTNGAELVGCEQGVAPWEDTSQVHLKLSGNSTRKAHWDARLGYHGNAAILSRLTAVRPDGGKVAKLRAFVTRVYPALYVEKFDDGSTVTRSERLENIHQSLHETDRQMIMEKLYEEVQKELADQDSPDTQEETLSKRDYLESGTQILRAMTRSKDPQEYRHNLTSTQQHLLENQEFKKQERYLQEFQDRVHDKMSKMGLNVVRNVVALLKARIVDLQEIKGTVHVSKAILSIWKPSEPIRDIVKEGTWIEVLNVVPTAVRFSETQISAGRQSIFSQSKYQEPENMKPHMKTLQRTCYPIKDIAKNPYLATDYNEVDTVGFIFEIDPEKKNFDPNKNQFQNVYLTDENKNIICVNFWGGLSKFGFENILDAGQVVACTNLQKRSGNTRKNIPQYRATEFSYFTKTPRSMVAREMVDDLGKKMAGIDKGKFCSDCISFRNNFSVLKLQNTENVSPYRFSNIDINSSKNKVFIDSPLAQKTSKTDENLNLTGLDFESTFNQAETQELSPKTLLRKRQLKEKISKLKIYGEPPPLSPMIVLNKSKKAGSAYKSPLVSKPELSVASQENNSPIQENSNETSPILSLNKTYLKRCVHPVKKLDFSTNIPNENSMNDVDHFAEDFDESPPLSLD